MPEFALSIISQLGAVGILIWFLWHLYNKLDERMEKREKKWEAKESSLTTMYETKVTKLVDDHRADLQLHRSDRDSWLGKLFSVLVENTKAFEDLTSEIRRSKD